MNRDFGKQVRAFRSSPRGYERADSEQEADVVLLNTCSVRDMADQKALGKNGNARPHRQRAARTLFFGFSLAAWRKRAALRSSKICRMSISLLARKSFIRVADYVDDALERKLTRAMDDPRFFNRRRR